MLVNHKILKDLTTGRSILFGGEKDCESEVSCPTTQHFCLVQGPTLRISSQNSKYVYNYFVILLSHAGEWKWRTEEQDDVDISV